MLKSKYALEKAIPSPVTLVYYFSLIIKGKVLKFLEESCFVVKVVDYKKARFG